MITTHDAEPPLTASGNLRRRNVISRAAEATATAAALLAVGVLAIVLYTVASRGADALSLDFLIREPPQFGGPGGGVASALVGTGLLIFAAALIAMPLGVLTAIYLTEHAGSRSARGIGLALDLLNGLPTIVVGLFVFGLLVVGHQQSGFDGAFALAIIMLPLIGRASEAVLLRVPRTLREAADALGVSRWRAVLGIILPSALSGIVTATMLAVARAAGETAPLILTDSIYSNNTTLNLFGQAVPNIPVLIFKSYEDADPAGYARAWGAGFVLLSFILLASLGARWLLSRGSLGGAR